MTPRTLAFKVGFWRFSKGPRLCLVCIPYKTWNGLVMSSDHGDPKMYRSFQSWSSTRNSSSPESPFWQGPQSCFWEGLAEKSERKRSFWEKAELFMSERGATEELKNDTVSFVHHTFPCFLRLFIFSLNSFASVFLPQFWLNPIQF